MMILGSMFTLPDIPSTWSADWAWGIPLIVLTVLIHVLGLGIMSKKTIDAFDRSRDRRRRMLRFAFDVGSTTLFATILHGLEAALWAAGYRLLHALPDNKSAMLYSLNAITSYGHTNLGLEGHWELMGAMEALNGWLLFGLSTAFLFAVIQQFSREGESFG